LVREQILKMFKKYRPLTRSNESKSSSRMNAAPTLRLFWETANKVREQSTSIYVRAAVIGLLLLILQSPVAAQTRTLQGWPEIDAYWKINSHVRISFFAGDTKENGRGTNAEVGPNIDLFLKPLFKLERITIFHLDQSKARPLSLRMGYRYMPATNGPTEHRGIVEATARFPIAWKVLLSDRNRADLRYIGSRFSWRYRNRLTAERTVALGSYHFIPYVRGEVYYGDIPRDWTRTTESLGSCFPIHKHIEIEGYFQHQNDTSGVRNRQVDGLGLVLSLYL
jgi:hypothetical protein